MVVNKTDKKEKKSAPKDEVNAALDKIFDAITVVMTSEEERRKITLDRVDATLNALFDAINSAKTDGKKTKIPDFRRMLTGED